MRGEMNQVVEVAVNISCSQREKQQADTNTNGACLGSHSHSQGRNGNGQHSQKQGKQLTELLKGKPAEGKTKQEKTYGRRSHQPQVHLHGPKLPGKGQGRGEQCDVNHHIDEEQRTVNQDQVPGHEGLPFRSLYFL